MSGILMTRAGRLLTAGACGVAVLGLISAAGLAGFAARAVTALSSLAPIHLLFVLVGLASLAVAYAWRRSALKIDVLRRRALDLLVDVNRRFGAAPDEADIRRRLAEAIADLTGRGAAVSGDEAALQWRAGKALGWRGALEAELTALANDAMAADGAPIVTLGAFHARTDGLNSRIFGAAVWVAPTGSRALVRETDHYAALLIELAAGAIVRRRLDYPVDRRNALRVVAESVEAVPAASGRLITIGRLPAA
jgi:hypothetical protein